LPGGPRRWRVYENLQLGFDWHLGPPHGVTFVTGAESDFPKWRRHKASRAGPEGRPGPPGPPGPAGPAGPSAPVSSSGHVVRTTCSVANCVVECEADEILIAAWCGAARNPMNFLSERSATCRGGRGAGNNPVIAFCVKSSGP
jgi:hypothetical protein